MYQVDLSWFGPRAQTLLYGVVASGGGGDNKVPQLLVTKRP